MHSSAAGHAWLQGEDGDPRAAGPSGAAQQPCAQRHWSLVDGLNGGGGAWYHPAAPRPAGGQQGNGGTAGLEGVALTSLQLPPRPEPRPLAPVQGVVPEPGPASEARSGAETRQQQQQWGPRGGPVVQSGPRVGAAGQAAAGTPTSEPVAEAGGLGRVRHGPEVALVLQFLEGVETPPPLPLQLLDLLHLQKGRGGLEQGPIAPCRLQPRTTSLTFPLSNSSSHSSRTVALRAQVASWMASRLTADAWPSHVSTAG